VLAPQGVEVRVLSTAPKFHFPRNFALKETDEHSARRLLFLLSWRLRYSHNRLDSQRQMPYVPFGTDTRLLRVGGTVEIIIYPADTEAPTQTSAISRP